MMYLEYDWTFNCYRFRFGNTFIDVRGRRTADTRRDAELILRMADLKIGRKTASRTWQIVAIPNVTRGSEEREVK